MKPETWKQASVLVHLGRKWDRGSFDRVRSLVWFWAPTPLRRSFGYEARRLSACFCYGVHWPLFRRNSQMLLKATEPGEVVMPMPSDLAIFEADPRKDLPCSVTERKPELGFDLRFHAGYEVAIPLKEIAGRRRDPDGGVPGAPAKSSRARSLFRPALPGSHHRRRCQRRCAARRPWSIWARAAITWIG